jgi:hypothetical protein
VVLLQFAGFMPKGASQFILGFGVAVILDPLLVMLVDVCKHNYDCSSASAACHKTYTSCDCDCFTGDFAKVLS